MAWDTKDNALGAPISLSVLTIISYIVIYVVFFKVKAKIEADLASRVESLRDDKASAIFGAGKISDIELIIENPIR